MQAPGDLELRLVLAQVRLTMRDAAVSSHHKWLTTMSKLVVRIRAAALGSQQRAAQHHARLSNRAAARNGHADALPASLGEEVCSRAVPQPELQLLEDEQVLTGL